MLKKFYVIVGIIVIIAVSLGAYFAYRPTDSSADYSMYKQTPEGMGFRMHLDTIPSASPRQLCLKNEHSELTARVEFNNLAGLGRIEIMHRNPLVSIVVLGHNKYTETRDSEYITRSIPSGWGGISGGYVWEHFPLTAEDLGPGRHRVVATAVFTLDLEPPYNWIRVVSNTITLTVCSS